VVPAAGHRAQPTPRRINLPRCYQQTKSQQIVLAAATFILIAESTSSRVYLGSVDFNRVF
jgi:hypothetical protein